jgi:hypothetical protein
MEVTRRAMVIGGAAAVMAGIAASGIEAQKKPVITVYKEPT